MRSNAGLYYETGEEFAEALFSLEATGPLGAILGRNGLEFFKRHYAWPVIERKYLDMFQQLQREPAAAGIEALPGWLARRRRTLPPARQVLASVPAGPVKR
jgi:hypothetical protein